MAASFVARSFLRIQRNFIRNAPRKVSKISTERCITLEDLIIYPDQGRLFSSSALLCSDSLVSEVSPAEVKKLMESLTDKFKEARELLDDARESRGTVYFSDDVSEAQQAVDETLIEYRTFLGRLSEKQRLEVVSTLGLRMEELKAQQKALDEELKHD